MRLNLYVKLYVAFSRYIRKLFSFFQVRYLNRKVVKNGSNSIASEMILLVFCSTSGQSTFKNYLKIYFCLF